MFFRFFAWPEAAFHCDSVSFTCFPLCLSFPAFVSASVSVFAFAVSFFALCVGYSENSANDLSVVLIFTFPFT